MAASPDCGTGTTLTFSGITYELTEIDWDGWEIAEVDYTQMSSSTKETGPGDLPDYGAITATVLWDEEHALPTVGDSQALTIDPTATGSTHTYTGTAFLQAMTVNIPLEDRMTATCRFRWEGAVTKV
jgi:hypothetical protein